MTRLECSVKRQRQKNQVLFCDVRDLAQIGCGSSLLCTDKYLSVETPSGVQPFTTQDWIKAVTCYRPDIAVAMSDSVNDVHAGHRRIKKSVDRSLRWLDECLRDMKDKVKSTARERKWDSAHMALGYCNICTCHGPYK